MTDPEPLEFLETEPTLAVLVEYLHAEKGSTLEPTMESRAKALRAFARDRGLLVRGNNRFPGGANVLSRKTSGSTADTCGVNSRGVPKAVRRRAQANTLPTGMPFEVEVIRRLDRLEFAAGSDDRGAERLHRPLGSRYRSAE